MRYKIFIVFAFILISNVKLFAQNSEVKVYSGVFLEYNTLLLTHNLKLFTDLNYYKDENMVLAIQHGADFIYSLPGAERNFYSESPHYDFNLLGTIELFPNYGISIKPFIGLSYRIKKEEYENGLSSINLKYGSTLQLNLYNNFKLVGKVMNVPKNHSDDVPILLGVGIVIKIF